MLDLQKGVRAVGVASISLNMLTLILYANGSLDLVDHIFGEYLKVNYCA